MPPKAIADFSGGLTIINHGFRKKKKNECQHLNIRRKIPVSLYLLHGYANFQGAVYLTILHQVSPDDTLVVIAFIHILGKIEFDSS
jgi:hypothetical protein